MKWVYDRLTREFVDPDEYRKRQKTREDQSSKRYVGEAKAPERGVYRYNHQTGSVEKKPDAGPTKSGLQIMKDLEPYTSAHTGEYIGGRTQHRDHLRAHGLTEVGNERVTQRKINPDPGPEIRQALREHGL